jgi:hypothetical protein
MRMGNKRNQSRRSTETKSCNGVMEDLIHLYEYPVATREPGARKEGKHCGQENRVPGLWRSCFRRFPLV